MSDKFRRFRIRWVNWEYWPFWAVYLPVMIYWLYLSIRARSFGFFAAADPGIEYGGMRGESKYLILKELPDRFKPITIFIPFGKDSTFVEKEIEAAGLSFPIIAKPDIGERGLMVKKLDNKEELEAYHAKIPVNYLIQEYVNSDLEYALLHYRYPDADKGEITSVTRKGFFNIQGDGVSTVREILTRIDRYFLQLPKMEKELPELLDTIPRKGEEIKMGVIGNHCLGTEFINDNHIIDQRLTEVFDEIEKSLEGVYFARYDLRCTSLEDMKNGMGIYIVEINGTGAEPAHVYGQGISMSERYRVLFKHWRIIFDIARQNRKKGVPYMSLKQLREWNRFLSTFYEKMDAVS